MLPPADPTEGDRHAPTSLQSYRNAHDKRMQDFVDEGFVRSHTVAFGEPRDGQITIAGEIKCEGGIAIQVDKTLLILDGEGDAATVRTVDYRYHAYVEGRGSLFRYCSPHGDGHRPYHHVHRFEIPTLAAIVPVEEIRDGNAVPTLGDVLEEARDLKYSFDFWPATGEEE